MTDKFSAQTINEASVPEEQVEGLASPTESAPGEDADMTEDPAVQQKDGILDEASQSNENE